MRHWAAIGCLVFTLRETLRYRFLYVTVLGTPLGVYMLFMLALPSVWVKQSLHSVGGILCLGRIRYFALAGTTSLPSSLVSVSPPVGILTAGSCCQGIMGLVF